MTQYNYEFLQETFDEQQTAIASITNSLTFLTQIRATQKRQLLAMRDELIQAQTEIERLKIENAELQAKLNVQPTQVTMNTQTTLSALRAWVGNFKCHSYGQNNNDAT